VRGKRTGCGVGGGCAGPLRWRRAATLGACGFVRPELRGFWRQDAFFARPAAVRAGHGGSHTHYPRPPPTTPHNRTPGVTCQCRCSEPCALDARLLLASTDARRIHVARVVARARAWLAPSPCRLTLRLTRRSARVIMRMPGAKLTLRLRARDAVGNARTTTRSFSSSAECRAYSGGEGARSCISAEPAGAGRGRGSRA
jgi:hypothetical protein